MRNSILIFILLLAGTCWGQYTDSTPSLKVNVPCNVYSSLGGDIASGLEFLIDFGEASWAGFFDSINGRSPYDSVHDRSADLSPTLLAHWGHYINVNHMISEDETDICVISVCDSLVDAGWPADIYERVIVHIIDDSIQISYGGDSRIVPGGDSLDPLHRFPLQAWYNTCGTDTLCPTGKEWPLDLVWDSGQTIVALAVHKMIDTLDEMYGLSNALQCVAWDNMLIGAGSGGCYGLNQGSYWQSALINDWGGLYPSNPEWDACGRADVAADYCDFKDGYFGVLEKVVDYSDGDYNVYLNISNTPKANLGGYSTVGHDSVAHFFAEGRGGDLLYYSYNSDHFQLILDAISDLYDTSTQATYVVEYRVVTGFYDDRDIYNPGTGGSQTIAWGNWTAERAFACQLCVQEWDIAEDQPITQFSYGRQYFTGGGNERWYLLFSTDMGKPTGAREDSTIDGEIVMFRPYDNGTAIYAPPASDGGDTTGFTVSVNVGQDGYIITADSTRGVDSLYDDDGVFDVKANYGYTYLFADAPPPVNPTVVDGVILDGVIIE